MRVGLSALALTLTGVGTPPAQARTLFGAGFVGTAVVASGLDYTCAGFVSTLGGGGLPCPPLNPATSCDLALNGAVTSPIPNCHLNWGHNSQALSVSSTLCAELSFNTFKPGQLPVHPGFCRFQGFGGIAGWCDRNGGQVDLEFVNTIGDVFTIDLHFTGVGGLVVFVGHYWKAVDPMNHGLVVGAAFAFPPSPLFITPQSCLNKTARTFLLLGVIGGIPEPAL